MNDLCLEQNSQRRKTILQQLEKLMDKFPDVPKITEAYAKYLLCRLIEQNTEQDSCQIIDQLERLAAKHPDSSFLAVMYSVSLLLADAEDGQSVLNILEKLKETSSRHPDVFMIKLFIAIFRGFGIINDVFSENEKYTSLKYIEELTSNYKDLSSAAPLIDMLRWIYSICTGNDSQNILESLERMEEDFNRIPNIANITNAFLSVNSNEFIDHLLDFSIQYAIE